MVFLGTAAVICVLVCIEMEVLLVLHGSNPHYSFTGLEKLAIVEEDGEKKVLQKKGGERDGVFFLPDLKYY